MNDGTSVSYGPSRHGTILNPARLPARGDGYWIPPQWDRRGLAYGTDELVDSLVYLGRDVSRQLPGRVISVADLSLERGGRSRWHRSHQTGRDVDILFLVNDASGRPVAADTMRRYGADRAAVTAGEAPASRFFDDEANWVLVRSLMSNPIAEVQYIFVSDDLKQRLIDHATERGEPEGLIQQAGWLLHQPGDSLPHDDHFHVRIFCPRSDLGYGCRDFGNLRWHKKDHKYGGRVERLNSSDAVVKALQTDSGTIFFGATAVLGL